jgi:hypothetical protein
MTNIPNKKKITTRTDNFFDLLQPNVFIKSPLIIELIRRSIHLLLDEAIYAFGILKLLFQSTARPQEHLAQCEKADDHDVTGVTKCSKVLSILEIPIDIIFQMRPSAGAIQHRLCLLSKAQYLGYPFGLPFLISA